MAFRTRRLIKVVGALNCFVHNRSIAELLVVGNSVFRGDLGPSYVDAARYAESLCHKSLLYFFVPRRYSSNHPANNVTSSWDFQKSPHPCPLPFRTTSFTGGAPTSAARFTKLSDC